jgi:hypothetical protein
MNFRTAGWMMALGAIVSGPSAQSADLCALFDKPLITGASVSAGFRTESPGHLLAKKCGSLSRMTQVAGYGVPGVEIAPRWIRGMRAFSIVVAIDLFFWDTLPIAADGRSSPPDCSDSLAALERVLGTQRSTLVPLVIGNVPPLRTSFEGIRNFFGNRSCRQRINDQLASGCKAATGCHVLDLDQAYRQLSSKGISYHGRNHSTSDFLPDGLHLSEIGSQYVSEQITKLLGAKLP